MSREQRTESVKVRITARELAELQRCAENERVNVSEYIRAGVFSYMALCGNKFAWKLMGAGLAALVRERMAQLVAEDQGKRLA